MKPSERCIACVMEELSKRVASLTAMKILVVDDDETDLLAIKAILTEINATFQVSLISSGSDALHALERERWDLLILDLRMPGTDGLEVVGAMQAKEIAVPIVSVSGDDNGPLVAEALKRGVLHHIRKNYLDNDLKQLFNQLTPPKG